MSILNLFILRVLLLSMILCCFLSTCSKEEQIILEDEVKEEYPFFDSFSAQSSFYMKRHLIDYFKSIALGAELGNDLPLIRKWNQPMKVHIVQNARAELKEELDEIITELNGLFTDGFYIEMAEDSLSANFNIYIGDPAETAIIFPFTLDELNGNTAMFLFNYDESFFITSGKMFVKTTHTSLNREKHMLREELTQALGLANDIPYYGNSIFYEQNSAVLEYSNLDIEVIKLLYHPKMIAGIGASSVESILEEMFGL